jgi:hypothetical protein
MDGAATMCTCRKVCTKYDLTELLSVSDWFIIMIGPSDLLLIVPHLFAVRISVILVGTRDGRTQSARACKLALLHLALKTWVSGPLHPMVVLSFSRHFSLRPVVTDRRRDAHNK